MAKAALDKNPEMTLAETIEQLKLINQKVFQLKQGASQLISAIKSDDLKMAKKVIEVYNLEEIIRVLSAKD